MPAGKFFAYAAEVMKLQPAHLTDQPILALMRRIGIEPGKSFDINKAEPAVKLALESVPEVAQRLMAWKLKTLATVVNGWSMNTHTMGVYGDYYLKRAIVTQLGLGANVPEDAIYPINLGDETGKPLDGANKYTLHFDKGITPPASGPNRTKVFHVKHFGTIGAAGKKPVLVGFGAPSRCHTPLRLARLAQKRREGGAGLVRAHGYGKQPRLFLDPCLNVLAVAVHEAARGGDCRAGFCRKPPCPLDREPPQLVRSNDGIDEPEP